MKCKIVYDIYSKLHNMKHFNGDEPIYDDDTFRKIGSKPTPQMYPKSIVIRDGNGVCWFMSSNRRPVTTVPGECMLENVLLKKDPKSLVDKNIFYSGDCKYLGEAQRLAELLNTNGFEVVAVNFDNPLYGGTLVLHDIQIKSMTFYADNGKQLYEVPSDCFDYEYQDVDDNLIVDDKGTRIYSL